MNKLLYVDSCNDISLNEISKTLGLVVVKQLSYTKWNIQDSSRILTDPNIVLAVFNRLNEVSLLEIGLLLFLCKPILVTDRRIAEYDIIQKQVNYVEPTCNLEDNKNNFVSWFKYTMG